jgi:hypothetical protein
MSENTVHDVANRFLASPRKSLRVLSQETGLSRSMYQRARARAGCSPITQQVCVVCSCRHALSDDPTGKRQVGQIW